MCFVLFSTLASLAISCVHAADIAAGPESYRDLLRGLTPGDTLVLDAGDYTKGLDIHGLIGTTEAPISIVGATGTVRSVLVARVGQPTISIVDSAYVRIANLDLEGRGVSEDAVKADRPARFAHHIVIEGLRISGHAQSQQNNGISTKSPAWNWTIRGNRITDVGTGLYLGDSDGSAPFVRGIIEGNVVTRTRGYSMQIKHQRPWPDQVPSVPEAGQTIIRYNTFSKDEGSSATEFARPNLLLGHWPLAGRGADDRYLVYGNLFLDNPTEALFQAEGNVTLYNNVFINRSGNAVIIHRHNDVPRNIEMFHNTILARDRGVVLRDAEPSARQSIVGNAIFADSVVPVELARLNAVHKQAAAGAFLRRVTPTLADVDLAPLMGRLADRHWQGGAFDSLPDAELDFDRSRRARAKYGAYAGDVPAVPDRFRP